MTTKDIIKRMEKEFNRRVGTNKMDLYPSIRTLLESFGEEILDIQLPRVPEDISDRRYSMGLVRGFNAVQEKARLKVKEILQNIS